MSNLLNGIPVIGHAKGYLHYVTGNSYEGDKAMHAANRTTAVMAAGAVGGVCGPAAAVACAVVTGLYLDEKASVVNNKPQGIYDGISDITTDINNGDLRVRSVLKTGIYVGADALSGLAGASIGTDMSGAMGKSIVNDVALVLAKNGPACLLVTAGSVSHEVAKNAPSSQPTPRKSGSNGSSSTPPPSQPSASPSNNSKPVNFSASGSGLSGFGGGSKATGISGAMDESIVKDVAVVLAKNGPACQLVAAGSESASGSGSRPPNERNPDKKDREKDQSASYFSIFLRIFRVRSANGKANQILQLTQIKKLRGFLVPIAGGSNFKPRPTTTQAQPVTMFNLLNGIPVIGHAKGLLHYVSGTSYEGDEVINAANRTTAVMAGGAVGVGGGPAGVLAGATGAGLLIDTIASVVTNKPQGILDGISDIATNIENGDVPVKPVLKTGICVGALTEFGGGSIATGMSEAMGESIVKDVAVVLEKNGPTCQLVASVATGSVNREVVKNAPPSQPKPRKSGSSGSSSSPPPSQPSASPSNHSKPANSSAGGSGSQPPNERNPDKKDHEKDQSESHLSIFLTIFGVSKLEDVIIRGVHLFENLKSGQKKALKKLINQLRLNGYLTRVIETIEYLFNEMDKNDITFQNFLSLTKFVVAYIGEHVALENEAQKGMQSEDVVRPFKERREENCEAVFRRSILDIFTSLYLEILQHICEPQFRNIFSAIYHYFKHRVIPEDGGTLTLSEYFDIIKRMLLRIKLLDEYSELIDEAHPRRELVYDRVLRSFRRRIRIVLKIQDGKLELSSCYFLDYTFDDDHDSDEFIQ